MRNEFKQRCRYQRWLQKCDRNRKALQEDGTSVLLGRSDRQVGMVSHNYGGDTSFVDRSVAGQFQALQWDVERFGHDGFDQDYWKSVPDEHWDNHTLG